MEEWNKAKNKFHDSGYDTASFVTATLAKSVSTEVCHNMHLSIMKSFITLILNVYNIGICGC